MALKHRSKNIVTTARGKKIDFEALKRANETVRAVGNVPVNARGDELGPGGKIIKKREEVLADYYRDNPTKVPSRNKADAPVEETVVEAPVEETTKDDWVEDADGNFVKKDSE